MEGRPSSAAPPWPERGEGESMESGHYPERPGEPDCAYYIRTGLCRFGMTCKFNHPPNRNLAVVATRMKGVYPERIGQPECQYFLKTGTCKFGATCKFHHPKDNTGIAGQIQLNALGYPIRPNEKECTYYLRTGQCKFGDTCKFHHPEPSNTAFAPQSSTIYPSVQSPTAPSQQSYPGGPAQCSSRASFTPSPRWQGTSSYAQLVLPQGLVHVPSWPTYSGQLGDSSSESQQASGAIQLYSPSQQRDTSRGAQGSFGSYPSGSVAMGMYPVQRDTIFPERPDQPECQFYMKTGDCKFGAVCKFHHPRERSIPPPDCVLSPIGLPLRPGEPICGFYSRYGVCKFGPNCKFDHSVENFTYGPSPSSTEDTSVVRHLSVSSAGPGGPLDISSGMSQRIQSSEVQQIASGDEDADKAD